MNVIIIFYWPKQIIGPTPIFYTTLLQKHGILQWHWETSLLTHKILSLIMPQGDREEGAVGGVGGGIVREGGENKKVV